MSATPKPAPGVPEGSSGLPAVDLPGLVRSAERMRRHPVIDLGQALIEIGALDPAAVARISAEHPERLHNRCHELVEQVIVSEDELQRALARVEGLVEVDAAQFELDRHAFDVLPLREARWHDVLPLGPALDHFFVASWKPTSQELRQQLCTVTGHAVLTVWGSREAIEERLA